MVLVRTGGLFGLLVSLLIAGLFLFVVRPAIDDTTTRALDTANRAIDTAAQQTSDITDAVDDATGAAAGGDFLAPASYDAIVADVKSEIGAQGELLDFTLNTAGGNVKYRTGDRAAGLQWGTGLDGLEPVKVTLVGSGKLADNVFPIARLQAGAAAKLAAALEAKGFEITTMTLGLAPVSGDVRWTVTGEGDGRSVVFTAAPDGSGLERIG